MSIQEQKKKLHIPHKQIDSSRRELHPDDSNTLIREINAFVIMNFSNMSDIVYKWRIRPFVESLNKYLYLDDNESIHCISDGKPPENAIPSNWHPVDKINVIRADTNPETNFVMCNRICQQIQIADLVIVDVSMENVNVFYEFGMAVAQEKLILPICYNESFFKLSRPEKMSPKDEINEEQTDKKKTLNDADWPYGHHIDGFPWRRKLFEFYGIRYRSKKDCTKLELRDKQLKCAPEIERQQNEKNTAEEAYDKFMSDERITNYQSFTAATEPQKGFSDIKYTRFPYCDPIESSGKTIGEMVYNRLQSSYNSARYSDNSLIVYTMDGFLNEEQAGICIINFYTNITSQFYEEHCFCGDRVGVLLQSNTIAEANKDSKSPDFLVYSVGDIIHIGTNQATYLAHQRRIKPEEFFEEFTKKSGNHASNLKERRDQIFQEDTQRFMKDYIRNQAMPIYPDDPIYVSRIKEGLQRDILSVSNPESNSLIKFFCLYHVMLRTLKYTDELIVDVSRNSLQSLFWLGAAHAAGVSTIVVKHFATDADQKNIINRYPLKSRDIFDISGLWTAVLESEKVESFYSQLYQAQLGIEQNSRLMLRNLPELEKEILEQLYSHDTQSADTGKKLIEERAKEEKEVLESYYRSKFWESMLEYNKFATYLPEYSTKDSNNKIIKYTVKWDVETNSAFLRYISSHRLVGENTCIPIPDGYTNPKSMSSNFISIGTGAWPIDSSNFTLADYIKNMSSLVHSYKREKLSSVNCTSSTWDVRGFENSQKPPFGVFVQNPRNGCQNCDHSPNTESSPIKIYRERPTECTLRQNTPHIQLAQLLMWRNTSESNEHFWVSLIGTSGPSTTALASLFVTKEIFKVFAGKSEDTPDHFLVEVQHLARLDFIQKYGTILKEEISKMSVDFTDSTFRENDWERARDEYIDRVIYAVQMYLTTTLYQYFFPALKRDDIEQICNGLKSCIYGMMVAKVSPFSLSYESKTIGHPICASEEYVRSAIETALSVLRKTLTQFRGIEAIFKVEVEGDDYTDETDMRTIKKMDFIRKKDLGECQQFDDDRNTIMYVNCIYNPPLQSGNQENNNQNQEGNS